LIKREKKETLIFYVDPKSLYKFSKNTIEKIKKNSSQEMLSSKQHKTGKVVFLVSAKNYQKIASSSRNKSESGWKERDA